MTAEYLFVYGTLRREVSSCMAQLMARYCEYVAPAYVQAKLYQLDGYPGAVESGSPDDRVYGELYRTLQQDQLFAQLDDYEECSERFPQPHEYVRRKLPVTLIGGENGGKKIAALVYLYNAEPAGLKQIRSGDYLSADNDQASLDVSELP